MSGQPHAQRPSVNGWNGDYLEAQYEVFRADPQAVSADLRSFFQGYELGLSSPGSAPPVQGTSRPVGPTGRNRIDLGAEALAAGYRSRGHLAARLDPFGAERTRPRAIALEQVGLSEADLNEPVSSPILGLAPGRPLREVVAKLERVYLGSIGVEFMHVEDVQERDWLLSRWESLDGQIDLSRGHRVHVLELIANAASFESFLQRRYPGEKRFSLEGAESLIPLLDELLDALAGFQAEEVVLGMAHRGRLNVLNQILGKTAEQIFSEFEDTWQDHQPDFADGGGDVKYHRGYSATRWCSSGRMIHLAMASNPSHLEAVDPVVLGRARAKQLLKGDEFRTRVVPVLIHGDAAIAGQGIVAECLNFSQLQGYSTGGTVHVVVNNQIGFTTRPEDARSTTYCTDIAKAAGCPVFHVNGEDPEAVVLVARLAAEYRQTYKRDVFIDLWCYRKHGHNEQDEQSFTQPILARKIKDAPGVMASYAQRLLGEGLITPHDREVLDQRLHSLLDEAQRIARSTPKDPVIDPGSARWKGVAKDYSHEPVRTGVPLDTIRRICQALGTTPAGFHVNGKLAKLIESRASLWTDGAVSYADAELLAYGSLLLEGHSVRVSGQDCRRGTFSSRHAVLYDQETAEPYEPLNAMPPAEVGSNGSHPPKGRLQIYDSPLSEVSVLGFEYGYSLADPSMLVCWEAQFGDFVNGAQVIIDQFIASAQLKWERWSALTMLLPHGYEGAGPEHSSARLERFLESCANDNMQVVYPSTGAQIFHLLRRQLKRPFRRPLVVMTPKSLLRTATSTVDELVHGGFQEIIDDPEFTDASAARTVTRILLCTGKIYHELAERRRLVGRTDTALIRVEQLYPFHAELARSIRARYPNAASVAWVQEEPRNMGAFRFMSEVLRVGMGVPQVEYIGREASASPAPGSKKKDRAQQNAVLTRAIGDIKAQAAPAASTTSKAAAG